MSRLAQDGTVQTGKGKNAFFLVQLTTRGIFSPVDPYSAESADHTYPDHTPSSSSTYVCSHALTWSNSFLNISHAGKIC